MTLQQNSHCQTSVTWAQLAEKHHQETKGPQPQLRVSRTYIGVRDSVDLSCGPPQGLYGLYKSCMFYTIQSMLIKKDSDCRVSMTGAELVRLGGHSGNFQINIYCVYRLHSGFFSKASDTVRVTVRMAVISTAFIFILPSYKLKNTEDE
ncbi:hypothetical protein GN956_G21018 [Arapaima gigas]